MFTCAASMVPPRFSSGSESDRRRVAASAKLSPPGDEWTVSTTYLPRSSGRSSWISIVRGMAAAAHGPHQWPRNSSAAHFPLWSLICTDSLAPPAYGECHPPGDGDGAGWSLPIMRTASALERCFVATPIASISTSEAARRIASPVTPRA